MAIAAAGLALLVASLARETAAKDPPVAASPPDLGFYVRTVARWTDEHCAACHREAGAGGLRLLPPAADRDGERERRRLELESLRRFVDPESPWTSRLLRKVLGEDRGGLPHAGGAFLRPEDDAYDDLLDFACGATTTNLPPEPDPGKDRRAALGEEVALDASASFDRDDDPMRFRWQLAVRPPGSRAALTALDEKATSLRPDVSGTYVVRLRVFDGKVWSAWRPVVLEVLERTGPEAPDPVATSGLEALDPAALRRVRSVYGDVLGRAPTPPEALLHASKPAVEVAGILLATLEAGRALVEDAALRLGLVGDFDPVSEAALALPYRLAGGEATPADVEAALARDPAFLRAHPEGPALGRAVAALLGRAPTEDDVAPGRGTAAALEAALAGEPFRVAALRRLAGRYLGPADAEAVPVARATESVAVLARAFVASPAWAGAGEARREADDLAFVRALYADLLGRRPTTAEVVAVTRAIVAVPGSRAGRAAVVAVLLDSGEVMLPLVVDLKDPDAWVADRFRRTLGRAPTEHEARVYRTALLDPAGGPHLVVRGLLTSPEYASR